VVGGGSVRISLTELGLSDRRTQAVVYFEEALAGMGEEVLEQPTFFKDVVDRCTLAAQERGVTNGAVRKFRGEWFEFAVAVALVGARVLPFYYHASLGRVPGVEYDFLIWASAPVNLSAKTTLRERYKQADQEAMALKRVYPSARSYLLTINDARNVENLARKIREGEIGGLDGVFGDGGILSLIAELGKVRPTLAPPEEQVSGRRVGVTA
jgi:hypothetical protein